MRSAPWVDAKTVAHCQSLIAEVLEKGVELLIVGDESFGPVVGIIRARCIARGLGIVRRVESGICRVNGPTVHDEAQMPFGGVKGSGYGRFGGKAGIDSFTELRWVTVEALPGHYPI